VQRAYYTQPKALLSAFLKKGVWASPRRAVAGH
jgi:hypothetical protein